MKKVIIIVVIALAVIGGGVALMTYEAQHPEIADPYSNKSSRELALTCLPQEQLVMHIHPVLTIMVNGQKREVPPNIGIQGAGPTPVSQEAAKENCLHFIHTHDNTGKIHVESPVPKDYHLSDFFAVWDQPFSDQQILDAKVDDTHRIRMTVNGQESTAYGDWVLRDGDQIEISYETK